MKQRGLHPAQALEPPHSVDHTIYEEFLDRPHRREVCPDPVPEILEGVGVFSRENNVLGRRPCRNALKRMAAFPSCVFGPVERRAFAWLAAFCRSLVMVHAFLICVASEAQPIVAKVPI